MKVYIWQKGSLRLGNEECQEVLAALLIACYCAPARAQIDETRVFSTFLHLPNIWPDGCGSWFSINIWSIFWFSINIWSIFWFSIIIWSIFELIDATSSLLANIGCAGVSYCCLLPLKNQYLVSHQPYFTSFWVSTGCKGRKTHRKNWRYRQWCHIQIKQI